MAIHPDSNNQAERLCAARRRLTQLEAEVHRLRAELARLEAAGQDAAAERLEAELREHEGDLDREQRFLDTPVSAEGRGARKPLKPAVAKDTVTVVGELAAPSKPSKARRRSKPRRRRFPAFAVSLGLHAVLLFPLGVASMASLAEPPYLLLASSVDGEDDLFDDFSEITLDEVTAEDLDFEEVTTEIDAVDFNEISLSEADAPWASTEDVSVSSAMFDALPSDFGALMAGVKTGAESGDEAGQGGAPGRRGASDRAGGAPRGGAKFFGARSKGGRFVFVVDNSGSMKGGRLETTLLEIERSVAMMADDQFFHVIFYSDQAYPMFYPASTDKLEPATRVNKRRLSAWLQTVEMCVGGQLDDAMKLAEKMEPDTVFLLSDGEIGAGTMRYMTQARRWEFVVNTLGMTVNDREAAENLIAIAAAHNGLFFPVGVNPIAARMAQQRPVPYHNSTSGPGVVWGSKVKAR